MSSGRAELNFTLSLREDGPKGETNAIKIKEQKQIIGDGVRWSPVPKKENKCVNLKVLLITIFIQL